MPLASLSALFALSLVARAPITPIQQHDLKPAEAMKNLSFLTGSWVGQQVFNGTGATMVGGAKNDIAYAVGGRYIAETLSTTLTGRNPSDTRHFLTFDGAANTYKAWWFTDTSVGPMELTGTLDGTTLVLLNHPAPGKPELRFKYVGSSDSLIYTFEMKQGEVWKLLFTTTYHRVVAKG